MAVKETLENLVVWLDNQIEETPEITNGVYHKYRENILLEIDSLSTP